MRISMVKENLNAKSLLYGIRVGIFDCMRVRVRLNEEG